MGFLSAVKGANNNWGMATGSCINGVGNIGPEKLVDNRNHRLMISGASMGTPIVFGKEDVVHADALLATSEWVKYRIVLKDGKEIIATIRAVDKSSGGQGIAAGLMSFEYWLAGVIYK